MFIPFLDCVSLLMGWAVQLSNVLRGKGNRNTIEQRALHAAASCIIQHQAENKGPKLVILEIILSILHSLNLVGDFPS